MKTPADQLLFVGFNGQVVALDRATGEIAWAWKAPAGPGYVALLVDSGVLFASAYGYTYALDPGTGTQLWANNLAGRGLGVPCLATLRGSSVANSGAAAAAADAAQRNAGS